MIARRAKSTARAMWPLNERPGFLLRRAHQIHTSLFFEACAGYGVTPLQYSLLCVLRDHDGMDQTTLANVIALDRTTTTGALKRLESRGLINRTRSTIDRRSHDCQITDAGRALTGKMDPAARRAHEKTIGSLNPEEAELLMALLKRIVAAQS